MEHQIEIEGKNYHYLLEVNHAHAPVLVFLHDSLGSVTLWRDFPFKLAARARCNLLIFDRLGYGASDAMDTPARGKDYLTREVYFLRTFLQQLRITRPLLFGHSDGATIGLEYACRFPDDVGAVLLEGVHTFVEPRTCEGIREVQRSVEQAHLKERLARYHGGKVDNLLSAWMDTWLSAGFRDWNILDLLPSLKAPLCVFQGHQDTFGSLKQVTPVLEQTRGYAELYYLPEAGHNPHKEVPEFTLEKSVCFLQRVMAGIPPGRSEE